MAISKTFSTWAGYRPLAIQIFGLTAVLIHVWAILNLLHDLPSWLLRMGAWDVIGMAAYTLLFALGETLLVSALLILPGFFLPNAWRQEKYLAVCISLLLATGSLAVILQAADYLWDSKRMLVVAWVLGTLILGAVFLSRKSLVEILNRDAARVLPLAYLYLSADLMGTVIVLIRNL